MFSFAQWNYLLRALENFHVMEETWNDISMEDEHPEDWL